MEKWTNAEWVNERQCEKEKCGKIFLTFCLKQNVCAYLWWNRTNRNTEPNKAKQRWDIKVRFFLLLFLFPPLRPVYTDIFERRWMNLYRLLVNVWVKISFCKTNIQWINVLYVSVSSVVDTPMCMRTSSTHRHHHVNNCFEHKIFIKLLKRKCMFAIVCWLAADLRSIRSFFLILSFHPKCHSCYTHTQWSTMIYFLKKTKLLPESKLVFRIY